MKMNSLGLLLFEARIKTSSLKSENDTLAYPTVINCFSWLALVYNGDDSFNEKYTLQPIGKVQLKKQKSIKGLSFWFK